MSKFNIGDQVQAQGLERPNDATYEVVIPEPDSQHRIVAKCVYPPIWLGQFMLLREDATVLKPPPGSEYIGKVIHLKYGTGFEWLLKVEEVLPGPHGSWRYHGQMVRLGKLHSTKGSWEARQTQCPLGLSVQSGRFKVGGGFTVGDESSLTVLF